MFPHTSRHQVDISRWYLQLEVGQLEVPVAQVLVVVVLRVLLQVLVINPCAVSDSPGSLLGLTVGMMRKWCAHDRCLQYMSDMNLKLT